MKRYEIVFLACMVLTGLSLRMYFFSGTVCMDDLRQAFHGHFLFDSPDTKFADLLPHTEYKNIKVAYGRVGVNLPVWVVTHVFGVHEWSLALVTLIPSLAGIVFVALLLRMLGGPVAGMLAAAIYACLPVDIYNATVLLQDSMYAGLFALFLLLLVTGEQGDGRKKLVLLFTAGFVLGYMQYVKESAAIVLLFVGLWSGWKSLAARRIQWCYATIALGYVVTQILFGLLFWRVQEDALWYWRFMYELLQFKATVRYTLADICEIYFIKLFYRQWQFGYMAIVLPIAIIPAFLHRNLKCKLLLITVVLAQLYILYLPSKATPNIRYLLQISVPFILFIALGLTWILERFPSTWRKILTPLIVAGVVAATALPLDGRLQRYTHAMGEGHRRVYHCLMDHADPDDKVYVDSIAPIRTQRTLYQFNGFKRVLGGFEPLQNTYEAESGWVVLSTADACFRFGAPPIIPDNWFELYRYEYPNSAKPPRWTALFMILPERAESDCLPISPVDGGLSPRSLLIPDASRYTFTPLTFRRSLDSHRWASTGTPVALERTEAGLHCLVGGNPNPTAKQIGGANFSVPTIEAFRFTVSFEHPENIIAVYVVGRTAKGKIVTSWTWQKRYARVPRVQPTTYTLLPGRRTGRFVPSGQSTGSAVREIGLWLRVKPATQAGLILSRAAVTTAPAPSPDISNVSFQPVPLADSEGSWQSHWSQSSKSVDVQLVKKALHCRIETHAKASRGQYGGVKIAVPAFDVLRFTASFENPEDIIALYVYGYDSKQREVVQWQYPFTDVQRPRTVPTTFALVAGQDSGLFETLGPTNPGAVSTVHIFARLRPGATAGFTLHNLEVAPIQPP